MIPNSKSKTVIRGTTKKSISKKSKTILKDIRKPELCLKRSIDKLIISPNPENSWEAWQTFNPAAILIKNKIHFLYRAIGDNWLSSLGYANSYDGFKINRRLPYAVYQHLTVSEPYKYYSFASGGSWGGCEDPRIVRVGNENKLYLTYTACDSGLRMGISSIKLNDFLNERWNWSKARLISPPNEVHKNWVIFPEKINNKYAILHSINPKILIAYVDSLDFKKGEYINSKFIGKTNKRRWDSNLRGSGPPPIKTKDGWLVLYHANDYRENWKYKVGAMLLDIKNPEKVICRSKQPILEPEGDYEMYGSKPGIVYASGAIVKDGRLIIYYGGADNYVCVAHTNLNKFLKALKEGKKKKLKTEILKRKVK